MIFNKLICTIFLMIKLLVYLCFIVFVSVTSSHINNAVFNFFIFKVIFVMIIDHFGMNVFVIMIFYDYDMRFIDIERESYHLVELNYITKIYLS
jgi:hypothetical protein